VRIGNCHFICLTSLCIGFDKPQVARGVIELTMSLGRELDSLLLSYQESVLPMNYLGTVLRTGFEPM
jgi:hypothetical protein